MFYGGSEAEAVISSLLLQTETEKSKQILNQLSGGMSLQKQILRTC